MTRDRFRPLRKRSEREHDPHGINRAEPQPPKRHSENMSHNAPKNAMSHQIPIRKPRKKGGAKRPPERASDQNARRTHLKALIATITIRTAEPMAPIGAAVA